MENNYWIFNDMETAETILNKLDIKTRTPEGNFRPLQNILQDLAQKWRGVGMAVGKACLGTLDYTEAFLDTIELQDYLWPNKSLYDVEAAIQEDYEILVANDPIMNGDVFNWMSIDEFANYLNRRYGQRTAVAQEIVETKYYVNPKLKG